MRARSSSAKFIKTRSNVRKSNSQFFGDISNLARYLLFTAIRTKNPVLHEQVVTNYISTSVVFSLNAGYSYRTLFQNNDK